MFKTKEGKFNRINRGDKVKKILLSDGVVKEMSFDDVYKQFEGLIYSRVHKWQRYFYRDMYDFDDLMQLGRIALYKAYQTYKLSTGIKFLTWAVVWIDGKLKIHHRDYKRKMKHEALIQPTTLRLEDTISGKGGGDGDLTYQDCIPDGTDFEQELVKREMLREALIRLDSEYRKCVRQYFCNAMNESEIANANGYTQAAASRHILKALKILRSMLEDA